MTDEMIALSRRAVACKGWRWMPGMLTLPMPTVPSLRHAGSEFPYLQASEDSMPDLTDPATLGCLLALVRQGWGDCHAYLAPGPGWFVGSGPRNAVYGEGATEAEALVAALEASPTT